MPKMTRTQACDKMWGWVGSIAGASGQDKSPEQIQLGELLDAVAQNPATPLGVVTALGEAVRLAHQIGFNEGRA